jgi:hypothetical protein
VAPFLFSPVICFFSSTGSSCYLAWPTSGCFFVILCFFFFFFFFPA